MKHRYQAILFDLDGTLLDTANDLGNALNAVRHARQLSPLPHDVMRPFAGRGCRGLLKLGLNIDETHLDYASSYVELLSHYTAHVTDSTRLFPGMDKVLEYLEEAHIPWGIVTNKPEHLTIPLIANLQLTKRAACVVSGDTLVKAKPHPDPILHACKLLRLPPENCLYVGDSEIDIVACKAAGSPVIAALYGYIQPHENPKTWNADGYIQHPSEIISWLESV